MQLNKPISLDDSENDLEHVDQAIEHLLERFDSVQVFVSRLQQDDSVVTVNRGKRQLVHAHGTSGYVDVPRA